MVLTNEIPWRALSSGDVWVYAMRFRLDQSGCALNIGNFENSEGDSDVQPGQDNDLLIVCIFGLDICRKLGRGSLKTVVLTLDSSEKTAI